MQLYTGMRIGEVLVLERNDITQNRICIQRTLTRNKDDKVILGKKAKTENSIRNITINKYLIHIMLENAFKIYSRNKYRLLFYNDEEDDKFNAYLDKENNGLH